MNNFATGLLGALSGGAQQGGNIYNKQMEEESKIRQLRSIEEIKAEIDQKKEERLRAQKLAYAKQFAERTGEMEKSRFGVGDKGFATKEEADAYRAQATLEGGQELPQIEDRGSLLRRAVRDPELMHLAENSGAAGASMFKQIESDDAKAEKSAKNAAFNAAFVKFSENMPANKAFSAAVLATGHKPEGVEAKDWERRIGTLGDGGMMYDEDSGKIVGHNPKTFAPSDGSGDKNLKLLRDNIKSNTKSLMDLYEKYAEDGGTKPTVNGMRQLQNAAQYNPDMDPYTIFQGWQTAIERGKTAGGKAYDYRKSEDGRTFAGVNVEGDFVILQEVTGRERPKQKTEGTAKSEKKPANNVQPDKPKPDKHGAKLTNSRQVEAEIARIDGVLRMGDGIADSTRAELEARRAEMKKLWRELRLKETD